MIIDVVDKPNRRFTTRTSGLIQRFSTNPVLIKSLTGRIVETPQNLIVAEELSRGFNWGYGGLYFYGQLPEEVNGKPFVLREAYSAGDQDDKRIPYNNYVYPEKQKPIEVYNRLLKTESFMADEPTEELLIPDAQCLYVNMGDRTRRFFFSRTTGENWELRALKEDPQPRKIHPPAKPSRKIYLGDDCWWN